MAKRPGSKPKISIDDAPVWIRYTGKCVEVEWKSGARTRYDKSIDEDKKCKACGSSVYDTGDKIKFEGYCRGCYAKETFGVPPKVKSLLGHEYNWHGQTKDTRLKNEINVRGDRYGNDFGVGDIIRIGDSGEEGTVVDLHKYRAGCSYTFVAVVDFGKTKKSVPSRELCAVTNAHVDFSDLRKVKPLKSVESGFDPMKSEFKEIFKVDVARAIWMMYRAHYLCSDEQIHKLNQTSLEISKKLKEQKIPKDRLHLWFKNEFQTTMGKMDDEFIFPLLPYLAGEEKATYKIVPKANS